MLPQGRGPPIFCQERARERDQREGEREAGRAGVGMEDGGKGGERERGRKARIEGGREKQLCT